MNDIDPKNPPPPPTAAQPVQNHWDRFLSLLPYLGVTVLAIIGIGLAAAIVWGLFRHDSIVRELASADLARGVITFIFAVGTIGIALLLTFGALVGKNTVEEFAKAKEVLTILIGVFGTILGFYFGTSTGDASHKSSTSSPAVEIAEIRSADKQLITHISGGTRPYHYSITSDDKDFVAIKSKESTDGWIVETLPQAPKSASALTVDVTDGKDQKASRKLDIPKDAKP
jgi:hypothetical protein